MAAAPRLTEHLTSCGLTEKFQSYKPLHSTESALLRVKNNFIAAIDNYQAVLLVMLDLSEAFHTTDHNIFTHRLKQDFCISDTGLDWFSSYLRDRTNKVCISGALSPKHIMEFGFPQGSNMGPIGYSMYTHPVGKTLHDNNISYHIYADDTQLYVTFILILGLLVLMMLLSTNYRPVLHRSQTGCYLTNQDPPLTFVMSPYNSVILE